MHRIVGLSVAMTVVTTGGVYWHQLFSFSKAAPLKIFL